MRLILGIGNPGNQYHATRHNCGFLVLDFFAQKHTLNFKPSKKNYNVAEGKTAQSGFPLIKPSTYVNNSGIAAVQAIEEYAVPITDFLVIADDVNLEIGKIRIRVNGTDGGHNGINSIIYHLNSDSFPRLRIGIGSNFGKGNMADYVLTPFPKDEFPIISNSFEKAVLLIEEFIAGGIKQMLDANSKIQLL
ncbi:MAG: aminoacyl-tRNA hydrolase [Ignavibacteriaceae bacterium]|nr:aminoacyl-tRNA hydrolase [Ignavibacteriaceae bacterium]